MSDGDVSSFSLALWALLPWSLLIGVPFIAFLVMGAVELVARIFRCRASTVETEWEPALKDRPLERLHKS